MAKTYFDQQQIDDKILSGVYPIVIEKGNAHIENNIINLVFETSQTTLFKEIRKEFKLWRN